MQRTRTNLMSLDNVKIQLDGVDFKGNPKPGKYMPGENMTCYVNFQYYNDHDEIVEDSFPVKDYQTRKSLFLVWAVDSAIDFKSHDSVKKHVNSQTVTTTVNVFDESTPVVVLENDPRLASVIGFQAFLAFCDITQNAELARIELVKTFSPEVLYKFVCTSAFLLAPDAVKIGAAVFKENIPSSFIREMNTNPETMKKIVGEDSIGPALSLSERPDYSHYAEERMRDQVVKQARHDLLGGNNLSKLDRDVENARAEIVHAERMYKFAVKDTNWSKMYMEEREPYDKLIEKDAERKLQSARENLIHAQDTRERSIRDHEISVQKFREIERANRM